MPANRNGKGRGKSSSTKRDTTSVKSVQPSEPGTAPLLPDTKTKSKKTFKARATVRKTRRHTVKHVKIVHKRAVGVAIQVAHGYKKADAKIVQTAKRAVPETTRQKLAANRMANNGNLRFAVPVSKKMQRKLPVVVPKWLKHVRHAALPSALGIALFFAFAFAGASPPGYGGTKVMGSSGDDMALKTVTDNTDAVYVLGTFNGTVNFATDWSGSDSKTSTETNGDIFITKMNANGSYGWTKRIAGSVAGNQYDYDIATDSTGNVYVGGAFDGTVDFAEDWGGSDEKTSAGLSDGFITKINANGTYGWTKQVGDTAADIISSVAVKSDDSVAVSGSFSGTVVFDTDFGATADSKTSQGLEDVFITTINDDGTYGGTKQIGGTASEKASALARNSSNDLYIVGTCNDEVDFAADWSSTDEKTCNANDVFVTKINSDNTYGWTHSFSGSGMETANTVAADGLDNVFIGGSFTSTAVDFAADWSGSDAKTKVGTQDSFITKVNANGTYGWTHSFSGSSVDSDITGLAIDSGDNIYVSGNFVGGTINFAADWSGSDEKTATDPNTFVTKINSDNTYGWTKMPGAAEGAKTETGDLTIDSQDALFVVGGYGETVNFAADYTATDEKTSTGDDAAFKDVFITKITTTEVLHSITDATGLTYKDSEGTNLSSTGTSETNPLVYVHDQDDDTLLATVTADLSEDRDWSGARGDSDLGAYKMYLNDIISAPGADASLSLYVPKNDGDTAVILCPGAEDLSAVTKNCADKQTLTPHDNTITTTEVGGVDYWVISGVTTQKIGALSSSFPGVSITETDDSTTVAEGGAGDYVAVKLNTQPSEDVTVTLQFDPSGQLESVEPIDFTTSNWDTPVNVYLEAIDDNTIEGTQEISVGYTTASADEYYDGTSEAAVVTASITDNDQAGVTLHNIDNLVNESGDTAEICVTLTAQPTDGVTLALDSSNTNEATVPANITVDPADWNTAEENCFNVTGVDDDEVDGPQDAEIGVNSVTSEDDDFNGLDAQTITPVSITNQDNDTAGFTVSTSGPATTEAGGSVEACIKLTARPASNVVVPLSVPDTTEATLGGTSEITIAPANWNSDTNCATVTGVDDDMVDGDIAYDVVTGDPTSADSTWDALDADDIANPSLTNEDDDTAGITIIQSESTTTVTEGGDTDTIEVVLTSQPAPDKNVVVSILPDTEIDLGEGAGEAVTRTFDDTNWNTPQAITVTAEDDESVEGDHNAAIAITVDESTTETPYLGLDEQQVVVDITDNDIATASIATEDDATEHPSSNGVFRVTLDHQNDTGSGMAFTYTVGGTAASGTHYASLSGTVTVPNGATTADIIVDVSDLDNELLEGNKTVVVTLTDSLNENAGISEANDAATITIFDDERANVAITSTQQGDEAGPTNIVYTATLSTTNNTGSDITVVVNPTGGTATSGADYEAFSGEHIAIANGAMTGTITVPVIDDEDFEALSETVTATITSPSIGIVSIDAENDSAEATIADNDSAVLSFTATQATATENPSTNGVATIALDKTNNTGTAINVTYTVSGTASGGSDYDTLSGTVTIANGQQSAEVVIDTSEHDDDDMEGNETVIVTYDSNTLPSRVSVGENDEASVTIVDDETAGITVSATDDTTGEDGSTGTICFALASHPSSDVTVALASSDTSKVTVPGSITIARANWNNAAENCVTVTGHDDSPPVATGTQDVIIQTTGVTTSDPFYTQLTSGDIADITVHHADNDTPGVNVQSVVDRTKEDGSKVAIVRFSLNTQPSSAVTIPVSVSDETEGAIAQSEIIIEPEDWNTPANNELEITGVDDNLTDGDITYQLITGDPTSPDGAYGTFGAEDVTNPSLINEDDDEAGITITESGGTTAAAEGGSTDTFTVVLTSQPASDNEVIVSVDPNGEIDLGEGAGQPTTLTFTNADWNNAQQITVTAVDDDDVEGSHSGSTVVGVDGSTTEAAYDELDSQTVNIAITDNDIATASIEKIADAAENPSENGAFRITLDKTNHTGSGMDFTYTVDGTAVSGTHYAALSGTATIANNNTTIDIPVDVSDLDNELLEGNKTVIVTLTDSVSDSGVISESDNTATVTIADDERATASITATQNGSETGPTSVEYTVSLSKQNDTGAGISVAIDPSGGAATKGNDYQDFSDQTVTVPNGSSIGTFQVTVIDDTVFEAANETLEATISDPSSNLVSIDAENNSAVATIADNDTAELSITASQPDAAENPSVTGEFTFGLDKTNYTGSAISITYNVSGTATADSDYDALSGSVSIPNGQQSATVVVDTGGHNDNDMEGDETVIITYEDTSLSGRVTTGDTTAATVTIADDEAAGVSVNVTDNSTSENGATGTICFTLASRPSASVTIHLTSGDSAKVSVPASITIERDNWNQANENCVTVTGMDDDPPEVTGTQTVTIQTTGVTSDDQFYAALSDDDIADATIDHADNDMPGVSVHTVSTRTSEDGSKSATIQFELATQPTDSVVIPVSVSDSTEGSIAVSSITISPANWDTPSANEITVTGVDDYLIDGDITYQLVTGDPASSDTVYDALDADDTQNVTLTNEDDDEAGVTIVASDGSTTVGEDGTTDTVAISIGTQPAEGNQVVITATPADTQLDVGAGAGVAKNVVFTEENWGTPQIVTIAALDDTLLEDTHSSQVTYTINTNDTTEGPYNTYEDSLPATNVTITDNDTATATVTVENGSEAGPTPIVATVTLDKQNDTAAPITFSLNPNGGTATTSTDYANFADTTVSIPVGETAAEVEIGVVDDAILEGDETVGLALSDPSIGIVSIANPNPTATLTDNDTASATVVATDPTAAENPSSNGEFTIYISKVNNTGAPITISYAISGSATAGEDYAAPSGEAVIASDASSVTIPVDTSGYNDATVENSETVAITLESTSHSLVSVGNPDTATVTIVDDDGFTTSIEALTDGSEVGPTNITYRISLSQVNTTGDPVTVELSDSEEGTAVSGDDYQAFGGTVSIPNGQQYADYTVTVVNDDDLEDPEETVEAVLSNPSEGELGVDTATATITDNETATVSITATQSAAHENPSENGVFTISIDKLNKGSDPILITYTTNGTATASDDYAALSGTAMIASGENSTTITVNTSGRDDTEHEGDETVIINLSSTNHPNVTVGGQSSATVTIIDDDPEPQEEPPADTNDTSSSSSGESVSTQDTKRTTTSILVPTETIAQAAQSEVTAATPKPQPVDQTDKDLDSDGIQNEEENKANNNGDGNGDGIPDSQQEDVASLVSKITNKPVTLEARGDCHVVEDFKVVTEGTLNKQDGRYKYPFGLVDYKLGCEDAGQSGIVTVYYDQAYDNPGNWRKFAPGNESYMAMDFVKNIKQPVGNANVTTVTYIIRDGGNEDDDGKNNGKISDPAGFAVRTFYILDAGWAIPVLIAGWFAGYAIWHRAKDHRRYK